MNKVRTFLLKYKLLLAWCCVALVFLSGWAVNTALELIRKPDSLANLAGAFLAITTGYVVGYIIKYFNTEPKQNNQGVK